MKVRNLYFSYIFLMSFLYILLFEEFLLFFSYHIFLIILFSFLRRAYYVTLERATVDNFKFQ